MHSFLLLFARQHNHLERRGKISSPINRDCGCHEALDVPGKPDAKLYKQTRPFLVRSIDTLNWILEKRPTSSNGERDKLAVYVYYKCTVPSLVTVKENMGRESQRNIHRY
ncbi:hypothetical protein POM88_025006 [Heracleum sosnowskyi]|uniref:Uncharacterized protein n=1 Tax=Heracleum sosnowskyi TaxID=360622 RepID=A0AAD8I358_9APIA|nr:hypothetical protein POM88_025006 [Heracleum sosnowskyi]